MPVMMMLGQMDMGRRQQRNEACRNAYYGRTDAPEKSGHAHADSILPRPGSKPSHRGPALGPGPVVAGAETMGDT